MTTEVASKYDNEERNHLLRKRKLHLLVDIDQTLLHTTNAENHYPSSSDVVTYQLSTSISQAFCSKLRPGVKEFLTNLQPFYQFHLVTFGDRTYAHTIAKLIDPDRTFFSHRILSRDECLSLIDETVNLSSLFPFDDSLVCIIDDREDIWNNALNLVQVKPYTWFKDVGNINDTYLSSETDTIEEKHQRTETCQDYRGNDEMSKTFKEYITRQIPTKKDPNIVLDTNLYLYRLEIILKRIHTQFYAAYDNWIEDKKGTMPDLKQIIPNLRRQVLNSVSLCFSHLMPPDYPIDKHRATIMAQALGAKVTSDLHFDQYGTIQTTHIIAGKGTLKVYRALQNNIKVVTPEWLIDCYEQWEKKPEENYILTRHYKVYKSRVFMKEISRTSKRRLCDIQQQIPDVRQTVLHPPWATKQQRALRNKSGSLSNKIAPEDLFGQYNFHISTDERLDIESGVNDLCIEDDKDYKDTHSRPSKCQRTMITSNVVDYDLSSICKLQDLILREKDSHSDDVHPD